MEFKNDPIVPNTPVLLALGLQLFPHDRGAAETNGDLVRSPFSILLDVFEERVPVGSTAPHENISEFVAPIGRGEPRGLQSVIVFFFINWGKGLSRSIKINK